MRNKNISGHLSACLTIVIWGTTFISTKILLEDFKPMEILFFRFLLGFLILAAVCPKRLKWSGLKRELTFAAAAAVVWACYSVLSKKISSFGFHTILTTRRVFAYGIIFMIPFLALGDFYIGIERFKNPAYLGNMLFLGIGASALCFVTWNTAVRALGAIKTSIYIYLVPVITMAASALILDEKITFLSAAGAAFTLSGLLFSEWKGKKNEFTE